MHSLCSERTVIGCKPFQSNTRRSSRSCRSTGSFRYQWSSVARMFAHPVQKSGGTAEIDLSVLKDGKVFILRTERFLF